MTSFSAGEERYRFADGHRCGQSIDILHHHVVDAKQVERVDAVFAHDVLAAPRDLFGEDRALEQQHGERISRTRGNQKRSKHRKVAGQLDGEQDRSQR
ncbi:hypothetical protein ABIA95_005453 [Bradyrhizobium sp. LA8.1]